MQATGWLIASCSPIFKRICIAFELSSIPKNTRHVARSFHLFWSKRHFYSSHTCVSYHNSSFLGGLYIWNHLVIDKWIVCLCDINNIVRHLQYYWNVFGQIWSKNIREQSMRILPDHCIPSRCRSFGWSGMHSSCQFLTIRIPDLAEGQRPQSDQLTHVLRKWKSYISKTNSKTNWESVYDVACKSLIRVIFKGSPPSI